MAGPEVKPRQVGPESMLLNTLPSCMPSAERHLKGSKIKCSLSPKFKWSHFNSKLNCSGLGSLWVSWWRTESWLLRNKDTSPTHLYDKGRYPWKGLFIFKVNTMNSCYLQRNLMEFQQAKELWIESGGLLFCRMSAFDWIDFMRGNNLHSPFPHAQEEFWGRTLS